MNHHRSVRFVVVEVEAHSTEEDAAEVDSPAKTIGVVAIARITTRHSRGNATRAECRDTTPKIATLL